MYDTPVGVPGRIDTSSGAILSGPLAGTTAAITPGEPAVISSRAGADAFNTKVQPIINSANATTTAARAAADARTAATTAAKATNPDGLPQDVMDELNAAKTEEQKLTEKQLATWDKQAKDAKDLYENLTLASNANAAATINSLTGQLSERKALLQKANEANIANWNQQFIRSGQAEYSPGMSSDLITAKEAEGARKVKQLDDEYNANVAAVNTALEKGNYEHAATLTSALSSLQDKAFTLMRENAKNAADENKKLRENLIQTSREIAISGLVKQGITDPTTIQQYLNTSSDGMQTGDITLDEISKVLKIVDPSADLTGLSSDYKTFKYLQDNKDPAVAGLDYMGYLKAVGIASRKADTGTDTVGKLSTEDQRTLLGAGLTATDINNVESDVANHGIDAVLADGSLSEAQKAGIKKVYGGKAPSIFTRSYLASLYDISDDLTTRYDTGFLGLGGENGATKLDQLEGRIKAWQNAGYSDEEIQKQLEAGGK